MAGKFLIRHELHSCRPDQVNKLIRKGSDVNIRDRIRDETPLHTACADCHKEKIVALLKKGAKINVLNACGLTPLCQLLVPVCSSYRDTNSRIRETLAVRLISVGFIVVNQRTLFDCQLKVNRDKEFDVFTELQRQWGKTLSLKSLCRNEIREQISGVRFNNRVHKLPLPSTLKQFIRFEDVEIEIKCVRSSV